VHFCPLRFGEAGKAYPYPAAMEWNIQSPPLRINNKLSFMVCDDRQRPLTLPLSVQKAGPVEAAVRTLCCKTPVCRTK
jgi:hypothetical protein